MTETLYALVLCTNALSHGQIVDVCQPPSAYSTMYATKEECEVRKNYALAEMAAFNKARGMQPGDNGYYWNECVHRTITPMWQR